MKKIEMYCVTNKDSPHLNKTPYNLAAVGRNHFSKNYLRCDNKDNIFYFLHDSYGSLVFSFFSVLIMSFTYFKFLDKELNSN